MGLAYNAPVRRVPFHRSLSVMAVVAMLLIVLAPVLSRWLAHGSAMAHPATMHAQEHQSAAAVAGSHHHGGHPAHGVAIAGAHNHPATVEDTAAHPQHAAADPARGDPHANHEMGVDCDYCLIAARMLGLLLVLLLASIVWRPSRFALARVRQHGGGVTAGHLGARGPPQPV